MANRFDDWYDWVNPVRYAQAGYDAFYGDPANQVKAAYDTAMGQSKESGAKISDFLMGQQDKALGFYKKPQGMFDSAYGNGLMPQQMPRGVPPRG